MQTASHKEMMMNYATLKPKRLLRALWLVPLAALYVGTAAAQTPSSASADPAAPQEHMQQGPRGTDDNQSMMKGMETMPKMQMSGDPDKDFAMMMKIHHQKALQMAQKELEIGKSPAMKAMATKILAAQQKEIAELDRWLAKQK
jgi:uncharacterized protein (DUF305 family)